MPVDLVVFDVSGTLMAPDGGLYPAMQGCLEALRKHDVGMAIATSLPRRALDAFLLKNRLTGFFESTKCADDAAPKPDPEMLKLIWIETGHTPPATLMVGDSESDVHMARAGKCRACGVTWGGGVAGILHQADIIAHTVDDLLHYVLENNK